MNCDGLELLQLAASYHPSTADVMAGREAVLNTVKRATLGRIC